MESLFTETTEAFENETVAYVEEAEKVLPKKINRIRSKRSSSKNFTADLDSLLSEALSDSFDTIDEPEKIKQSSHKTKKQRKSITLFGLDALIRKTVDYTNANFEEEDINQTKRLTISVNKRKLKKLKEIAKKEKVYLKDILGKLISEYVSKFNEDNF